MDEASAIAPRLELRQVRNSIQLDRKSAAKGFQVSRALWEKPRRHMQLLPLSESTCLAAFGAAVVIPHLIAISFFCLGEGL
jgi:hypothetical protein